MIWWTILCCWLCHGDVPEKVVVTDASPTMQVIPPGPGPVLMTPQP